MNKYLLILFDEYTKIPNKKYIYEFKTLEDATKCLARNKNKYTKRVIIINLYDWKCELDVEY